MADTLDQKLENRVEALEKIGIASLDAADIAIAEEMPDSAIIGGYDPLTQENINAFLEKHPDLKDTFNACVSEESKYLLEEVGLTSPEDITNRANAHCMEATIGGYISANDIKIGL